VLLLGGAVVYGQALTAGRAGYVTWAVVGLFLCLFRWRRQLLLVPIVVLVITSAIPSVVDRLNTGFGPHGVDVDKVTAGRTVAWPVVLDKIDESPLVGFGRQAMRRTGLSARLESEFDESFPHPHNAYLEALLDNGVLGFAPIIAFYVCILVHAVGLLRDRRSAVCVASGGVACALVLALLSASMGSQTFYPREGALGMWCAIGLVLRVWVTRAQARAADKVRGPAEWWRPVAAPQRRSVSDPLIGEPA
jgi:O-antigen ligase